LPQRYAIIVAAGSGSRLSSALPKQFIALGGKPMLQHSLDAFRKFDPEIQLLLALPEDKIALWKELARDLQLKKDYLIIKGGSERFYSVRHALQEIKAEEGFVAIHDAARPFLSQKLIENCFNTAEQYGSAVPAVAVKDSLRTYQQGRWQPADRSLYRSIQTPQVFQLSLLKEAYHQPYTPPFTDDATVYEMAGHVPHLVEGEEVNIKITTTEDLAYAQYLFDHKKPG
jgi:2-C-methyl-D-erythritol 4-phosphate cytidylyltransferase